ncbi:MAG: hypothetical protein HFJ50_07570 [Clostridia bacterium]|jgi:hypothetical protein|nr:hypothetical protein [Clostridia bacterium]
MSDEEKKKFEKAENVLYICEILERGKKYVKTMRRLEKGIEYIYYEIQGEKREKRKSAR